MNKIKQNMKRNIISIGILVFLLSACGEDFLDIPSKTSLTSKIYFETEDDYLSAINGTYVPLREMYAGSTPTSEGANGLYILAEMHSDNARYIYNPDFRATVNQENATNFITEASNTISTFQYRMNYRIIARANQILATIDEAEISESTKNNIEGQALFLRAFSYFNLVQYFGSVPIHLEPVTTIEETALPLSGVEEVYQQIEDDATQAINLLPLKSETDPGRVTKGSATMLLANVHMVEKDYAEAETLLKNIVNSGEYALMADYAQVFDPLNKNNSESVFEIQYREGTEGYSSTFCYSFLPYPLSLDTVAELTGVSDPNALTAGEGFNAPSPELIGSYETGDLRLDATIGYTTTTTGSRFPYCKKYLHTHSLLNQSNDNWPVYRYAEVLLFLAEAINEQNRPAEALTYINDVVGSSPVSIRGRAGLASITASSQTEVREAIENERRVELALENKRWLDLVRTGKATDVITAYGANIVANPENYYFPAGISPPPAAFTEIDLLWPLPADESMYTDYF
jgi:hypothetical protein